MAGPFDADDFDFDSDSDSDWGDNDFDSGFDSDSNEETGGDSLDTSSFDSDSFDTGASGGFGGGFGGGGASPSFGSGGFGNLGGGDTPNLSGVNNSQPQRQAEAPQPQQLSPERRNKFAKTGIIMIAGGVGVLMLAILLIAGISKAKSGQSSAGTITAQSVSKQKTSNKNTATVQTSSGASWTETSLDADFISNTKVGTYTITNLAYEASLVDSNSQSMQLRLRTQGNISGEIGTYEVILPSKYIGNPNITQGVAFQVTYTEVISGNHRLISDITPAQ